MKELDHLRRLQQEAFLEIDKMNQVLGRQYREVFGGDNLSSAFAASRFVPLSAMDYTWSYMRDLSEARQPWSARSVLDEVISHRDFVASHVSSAQVLTRHLQESDVFGQVGGRGIDLASERLLGARSGYISDAYEQARCAAEIASDFRLATGLEAYRSSVEDLTAGLLRSKRDFWQDRNYLEAFNEASAVARLVGDPVRVERERFEAAMLFSKAAQQTSASIVEYRHFLDAAGLVLPRWPRRRLLTAADKRRRIRARVAEVREPQHVRKAKTLVHKYEFVLRDVIDTVMSEKYGENWAEERLPLCECRDLLRKWRNRGGSFVLEYADYAHYARIMTHEEHFEGVFSAGFEDRNELSQAITRAGSLRAASHHVREFSADDLRELRVTWRLLESAMAALLPDYELDYED